MGFVLHKLLTICKVALEPVKCPPMPYLSNFFIKMPWSIVSNALERSRNVAMVTSLFSNDSIKSVL